MQTHCSKILSDTICPQWPPKQEETFADNQTLTNRRYGKYTNDDSQNGRTAQSHSVA